MSNVKSFSACALLLLFFIPGLTSQVSSQSITYRGSWGPAGISIESQGKTGVTLNFSVPEFAISDIQAGRETMKQVLLPGHFMHNEAGAPDLPAKSYFLAMPAGATATLRIMDLQTDTLEGIEVVPAPVIPIDDDNEPLVYARNPLIYEADAFYPDVPAMVFENKYFRGVNIAVVGISPFRYNPVTRQLIVYRDMKISVNFEGGNGRFGEERYRSRYWDPILSDMILNHESLPEVSYKRQPASGNRTFNGCEYLIITPDGAVFQQWADSIKKFRTEQGILTQVVTISQVGGNIADSIEAYINNAYNNWDIPPDACLLLADYGSDPATSITSNVLNDHPGGYNPYISDNLFADVTGNDLLPEVAFARITARNSAELALMVNKFLDYERTPPTNPNFYLHPITALGWQTERWFQICSETIGGYFNNELSKDPVRINAIYEGNPDVDPWSTASNTTTVLNYFGPSGVGYIPDSPVTLGGWTGGTAAAINNAINSGAFILQHRDHGYTQGWGEPAYSTTSVNSLTNTDLTFVMSINCQTGKFNNTTDCLAEKFHRYSYSGQGSGALGVIAPTEVSYSFVNDTYAWGFYDNLWPDFLPDMSTNPASRGLLPCFGNAAGKYHLQASTWPYSSQTIKNITYKLFHFHGDAFTTLYSEIPQALTVSHDTVLLAGMDSFTVTADSGAFISLVIGETIIGTEDATGGPVLVSIPGTQLPGQQMIVTATMKNHYRYRGVVDIEANEGPYVILNSSPDINDSTWNGNGSLDHGEEAWLTLTLNNLGDTAAYNVTTVISSDDLYLNLVDSVASYGTIYPNTTKTVPNGFFIHVEEDVPDGHSIPCQATITSGTENWTVDFDLEAHAPVLSLLGTVVEEETGNGNGVFDPGETAAFSLSILNSGSGSADSVMASLASNHPLISILVSTADYGLINPEDTITRDFIVVSDPGIPPLGLAEFGLEMLESMGLESNDSLEVLIGRIPVLILDLDQNHSSGPAIQAAVTANDAEADYLTAFPANLDHYAAVFVCLGTYNTNHVLSFSEGQLLADYLNNGGRLYMEGGDTWAYDPVTAVHAMFMISGLSDGTGNLTGLAGTTGTFTQGMSFAFSGENSYIDQIAAISPAFVIFRNTSPVYNTTIAFDAVSYRTIGSSFEFAGLTDGTYKKVQLMRSYLDFFGIPVTAEWLGVTSNWHDAANWSNGLVPDQNTNTIIPFSPVYPTQFSGGTANCKRMDLGTGVSLVLPAGSTLVIEKE